jgi:glycosyltransferase involved in cell wall biosynthesis
VKVLVSQKGAREHFLAARALHHRGALAKLVVDWYAPKNPVFQWVVSIVGKDRGKAAMAARCDEIPDSMVRVTRLRSLWWKWKERTAASRGSSYGGLLETDAAFARAVARCKLPPHDVFFGYSYASLEALEAEKSRGKMTILDQIDPGPAHFQLVAAEMDRHPDLAGSSKAFPTAYFSRVRQEWEIADVIVVNSEWSRKALLAESVNPAKIEILPLAYEAENGGRRREDRKQKSEVRPPTSDHRSLKVLWLGQVNVPKGIHYLMEAARLLEDEEIHFDVVGSISVFPATIASAPGNMTFHGPVSRDGAAEWYRRSDVFVLPTLSDGFALTQLEALAHGLPVIVTPNCGQVVENGVTGFIIPARDSPALAEAILKFVRSRNLASSMSPRCIEASKGFSIGAYGRRLMEIINKHFKLGPAKSTSQRYSFS